MKKHSDYEFIIAIRFWALCLILAPIILLLPLSRWVALVWMGGFIGGASAFAVMTLLMRFARN